MYRFTVLKGEWALVRLGPHDPIPEWALAEASFSVITRTTDELSIVRPSPSVPVGVQVQSGWAVMKLLGPFPFTAVGVLSSFTVPLAVNNISIFAVSTFDTDYILVKALQLRTATQVLAAAGHEFIAGEGS